MFILCHQNRAALYILTSIKDLEKKTMFNGR
jgi:hypothetical protein